jgi:DEAD/DEAH box helicase domain-containing protein
VTRRPRRAVVAEHAEGVLPLRGKSDRWDIGWASIGYARTCGVAGVHVHDGRPRGQVFAERGWAALVPALVAVREDDALLQVPGVVPVSGAVAVKRELRRSVSQAN